MLNGITVRSLLCEGEGKFEEIREVSLPPKPFISLEKKQQNIINPFTIMKFNLVLGSNVEKQMRKKVSLKRAAAG